VTDCEGDRTAPQLRRGAAHDAERNRGGCRACGACSTRHARHQSTADARTNLATARDAARHAATSMIRSVDHDLRGSIVMRAQRHSVVGRRYLMQCELRTVRRCSSRAHSSQLTCSGGRVLVASQM
jgi:hypothetical protein